MGPQTTVGRGWSAAPLGRYPNRGITSGISSWVSRSATPVANPGKFQDAWLLNGEPRSWVDSSQCGRLSKEATLPRRNRKAKQVNPQAKPPTAETLGPQDLWKQAMDQAPESPRSARQIPVTLPPTWILSHETDQLQVDWELLATFEFFALQMSQLVYLTLKLPLGPIGIKYRHLRIVSMNTSDPGRQTRSCLPIMGTSVNGIKRKG